MTDLKIREREALVPEHTRRWQQAALDLLGHSCPECEDPGGCEKAAELLNEMAEAIADERRAVREADARWLRQRAGEIVWEPPVEEERNYWLMNSLRCELEAAAAAIEALERE